MSDSVWTAVDRYIEGLLIPADPALEAALEESRKAALPQIQVSPTQGKFLNLLAKIRGASRILEIGTLGGYSTIWLARALPPDGRLLSLELEPRHAEVARANLARAGLADRVEVRVGPAAESLARLASEGAGPFDLIFLDADKEGYPDYLDWALRLGAPGSWLVADNVVRDGEVRDAASKDPRVVGVRRFLEKIAAEPRLTATVIPTVGSKGYDGFCLARRRSGAPRPP